MRRLHFAALILVTIGFIQGVNILKNTYSENYTRVRIRTQDGASIHQKTDKEYYGTPLAGDFIVSSPPGKYINVSNIREWILMQTIILSLGLLCLLISFGRKSAGIDTKPS